MADKDFVAPLCADEFASTSVRALLQLLPTSVAEERDGDVAQFARLPPPSAVAVPLSRSKYGNGSQTPRQTDYVRLEVESDSPTPTAESSGRQAYSSVLDSGFGSLRHVLKASVQSDGWRVRLAGVCVFFMLVALYFCTRALQGSDDTSASGERFLESATAAPYAEIIAAKGFVQPMTVVA